MKPEEKKLRLEEEMKAIELCFNRRLGFKRIFDALTNYGNGDKILIGHNYIYDVMFIITHFGDPLPELYKDFKQMVLKLFKK